MDNLFKGILKGKVVIVGIGNVLRGDDGAGPELVRRLKDSPFCLLVPARVIDAGEVPENYLEKIIQYNPDTILLVDAVDLKEAPGNIAIVSGDELEEAGFSTHNASLKLTIAYLKARSKADILLLGIQPKTLDMGNQGISQPVKKAIDRIEKDLLNR